MSEQDERAEEPTKIHPLQRLLDNPWALLILGLTVTIVSYTLWGWIELEMQTPATLP